MKYRIIVAGSREFTNYNFLKEKLNHLFSKMEKEEIEIVSGTARGVDRLGERYAKENELALKQFKPDWDSLGRRAGIIRNQEMAEYANYAVIFWNGLSRGSENMIETCKKIGITHKVIKI